MPSPKKVKRVPGSKTFRASAIGRVLPEYPRYVVVQVRDKASEDLLRKQLRVAPLPEGLTSLNIEAQEMMIWSVMSASNPQC